jgi:hypothetical protein
MSKLVLLIDEDILKPVIPYISGEFDKRSTSASIKYTPDIIALNDLMYGYAVGELQEMGQSKYQNTKPTFRGRPVVRIKEL